MSANFTISFVANESNEYVKIHKQLFYWIIKECSNYKIKELSDSANYTVNYIDEIEVKHGLDSNSVLIIDFVSFV